MLHTGDATRGVIKEVNVAEDFEGDGVGRATEATGLTPNTRYYYGVRVGNGKVRSEGQFVTFPPAGEVASFSFAFASCSATGSTANVYNGIRDREPLFYIQMGDMHYKDIEENNMLKYRTAFDQVWASDKQRKLFQSVPTAYVWDDHDFGPNDSNFYSKGREAAQTAYRKYFPHYALPAGDTTAAPIYQAFTVGRVRFLLTDLRSATVPSTEDDSLVGMLGKEQKVWLLQELSLSHLYSLVVWVSSKPWIGEAGPPTDSIDTWWSYSKGRAELADHIAARVSGRNLVVVSGDAHMVALDDGSNTDYSTHGGAGFVLMQAAPLHVSGNPKGGPFSHGCHCKVYETNHQYGLMEVEDGLPGGGVCLTLKGFRNRDSKPFLEQKFCSPLMKNATCVGACEGSKGSCSVANFGTFSEVLIGLGITAVTLVLVDALFVSRHWWTVILLLLVVGLVMGLLVYSFLNKKLFFDITAAAVFVYAQCLVYGLFSMGMFFWKRGRPDHCPHQPEEDPKADVNHMDHVSLPLDALDRLKTKHTASASNSSQASETDNALQAFNTGFADGSPSHTAGAPV